MRIVIFNILLLEMLQTIFINIWYRPFFVS